jgi:hypothetical protein
MIINLENACNYLVQKLNKSLTSQNAKNRYLQSYKFDCGFFCVWWNVKYSAWENVWT